MLNFSNLGFLTLSTLFATSSQSRVRLAPRVSRVCAGLPAPDVVQFILEDVLSFL